MRDPDRIYPFCMEFAKLWSTVPDLRFGQLITNIIREYMSETGADPFYVEDDEFMKRMKVWFGTNRGN